MSSRLAAILFLVFLNLQGSAQPALSFEHFNEASGLSAPVTDIIQDKFGFMWLGTTDGLNRFDGKNFIVHRNIPGDSLSIPSNIINKLTVDGDGRVWAATNSGLCYYDFSDDAFHKIRMNDTLEKIDRNRVLSVSTGSRNEIWFGTKTWIHKLENGIAIKSWSLPPEENLQLDFILAQGAEKIWIGTNSSKLYHFNPRTAKFTPVEISTPYSRASRLTVNIHPIFSAGNDTLLIGTWYGGLQRITMTENTPQAEHIDDPHESDARKYIVSALSLGTDGNWWVGTYGTGLTFFDPSGNQLAPHIRHRASDPSSPGSDYINDIFTDRSGITWIGTTEGLDKYDPHAHQFATVPIPEYEGFFSVYRTPSSILEDRSTPGAIWVTVSGFGLLRYHPSAGRFEQFAHSDKDPFSLPDNRPRAVYYDDRNRMWIGMKTGVCIFDAATKKFRIPEKLAGEDLVNIHEIFQDKKKRFWFASSTNGIACYDERSNNFQSWKYNEAGGLPDNHIFCMMEDHAGYIWIGTQNNGLCRLDPESGTFLYFMKGKKNPVSASGFLPDNGIYDLHEDSSGHLWIATENGFADMNLADFSIRVYTTLDGLCNNDVFTITPDQRGHYWLGTNNGISDFDPEKKTFKNYFSGSGLPANRIDGAAWCSPGGTVYFGARGTLISCDPGKMKLNTRMPPVVITGFRIFDKPVPVMRKDGQLLPVKLTNKENMITFDFAALNFSNPGLNQYAYRLEGFDRTWIDCGSRQSATYTNLDGGSYTFRVKAANNDGLWNEAGASVNLVISPPFWKTPWFYLLCVLAVAGIFYLAYRIRIGQILRLQRIRTRIARDLHDDVGSTLSSIRMISSMAYQSEGANPKNSNVLHTISTASSEAMELMNDIVWSVNPRNDKMEMILIRMRQYASEILEAANISFTLEMDENCRNVILPVEKRKDFYLIFKEAINNLAKYSDAKNADIRLMYRNRILHLIISDNGIGFLSGAGQNGKTGSGNGLINMQARAELLKGEMNVESGPGKGTRITLKIPVTP